MKRVFRLYAFKATKWICYLGVLYWVFIYLTGEEGVDEVDKVSEESAENVVGLHDIVSSVTSSPSDINRVTHRNICPGVAFPTEFLSKGPWQPVDEDKRLYAVSAYYDRDRNSVFVVGVRPENNITVICQLWKGDKESTREMMEEQTAREPPFLDFRGYKYTTTVFECLVKSPAQPTYVSIVQKNCDRPLNLLEISTATKELPYQRRLTVCLKPMISRFDDTKELVNWIEINKLLGVEKFVVYNHSCNPDVARLLQYYTGKGLVEVVQWDPPVVVNRFPPETRAVQLQDYGEVTALNDCLFRNRKYSEFISNIDINEFMIPREENKQLVIMVYNLNVDVAAYYINMAFRIRVGKKTENKTTVHTGHRGNRISRLIIRTFDVDFALTRSVPGVESFIVPPEISVLHRHINKDMNQVLGSVIDSVLPAKTMSKVKEEVQRIKKSLKDQNIRLT